MQTLPPPVSVTGGLKVAEFGQAGPSTTCQVTAKKPASWSGTISDSNCGAKHVSDNPAECTRACIAKGASYALVSGSSVYILKGGDTATLDKLAGERATVSGALDGNTIEVASVQAAK